jgi:trigger factor
MKIDIDTLTPVQRRIRVEFPPDAVEKEFFQVYENLGRRARIKGFRQGKVPRSVLQRLYGEEVKGEVLSRLVEHSLREVVKSHGVKMVSRPEIDANELNEGKTFSFSALVEVKPEIQVKNYIGLEVEKVKLSVSEAQVEMALRHLQEQHAQLEPVEERDVVEAGDLVILDFVGSVDGKPFSGGRQENYPLEIGSGKALPQFEAAIVGLKRGQKHTISLDYPTNYFNQELAAKTAIFSLTVQAIKKKVLPSLDDEFAKDHGDAASLDELKQKLRIRLVSELEEIQVTDLKEKILARLIEANAFEVPPAMIDRQVRYLMDRRQARLATESSSSSEKEFSPEQLRKELEPQARRQSQATLLIEKIAETEGIKVSDEEVQLRVEKIARAAGDKGASVREIYRHNDAREDLRSQMAFDRTVEFLLQRAQVKEVEPPVDDEEKKR